MVSQHIQYSIGLTDPRKISNPKLTQKGMKTSPVFPHSITVDSCVNAPLNKHFNCIYSVLNLNWMIFATLSSYCSSYSEMADAEITASVTCVWVCVVDKTTSCIHTETCRTCRLISALTSCCHIYLFFVFIFCFTAGRLLVQVPTESGVLCLHVLTMLV